MSIEYAGASAATAPKPASPVDNGTAAPAPDFDEYLRQLRTWNDVMQAEHTRRLSSDGGARDLASRRATCSGSGSGTRSERSGSANAVQAPAGEALTSVARVVPELFFQPDFDIGDPAVFRRACPIHLRDETRVARTLTAHLDLVRPATAYAVYLFASVCVLEGGGCSLAASDM